MGKYDPLRDHLAASAAGSELNMIFGEIEQLVRHLPRSARTHRAWWSNTADTRAAARAWRSAGWRVQSVDLGSEHAVFARDAAADLTDGSQPVHPRSPGAPPDPGPSSNQEGSSAAIPAEPDSSSRDRPRRRALLTDIGAAAISVSAAAVGQVAGLMDLPLPVLALAAAAVAGIAATVSQAAGSRDDPATARQWWSASTVLLLVATAGAFGYHRFLDPSNRVPRAYEFVVNGTEVNVIPLYGEAGGAEQILATGEMGQNGLIGGQTYSFNCWTIGLDSAEWPRYERFGQVWWAPRADLHPPFGESQPPVPHC
jgi:hypothetical protein